MNIYRQKLIIRISILIVASVTLGILVTYGYYLLSFILFVMIGWLVYSLLKLQTRINKDFKRFIDAIQFAEFNISFKNSITKGLNEDLANEMENAINRFNEKMQQKEAMLIFYEVLLNRIDFAIMVVNKKDQIIWINKIALDMLGKPQPRQLSDLKSVSFELPEILKKLTPKDPRILKLHNDKSELNLAVTMVSASIRGEEMKIFSLKDIQPILDETESEAWKKLVRILTHEMMNSITPIISLAETFSGEEKNNFDYSTMSKAMQTIYNRSKGLVKFVNNYQRLARIPAPELGLFKINDIMIDTANLLKAQKIDFSYQVNPSDITIKADRGQIEQVLINLVKNAWESCSQNEFPIVSVLIEKDEYQHPVITVSDNGAGILPDITDKIFIPFYTTKKDGSGIGLSICRQIIKAHGGSISVISKPDHGACFTIRLKA